MKYFNVTKFKQDGRQFPYRYADMVGIPENIEVLTDNEGNRYIQYFHNSIDEILYLDEEVDISDYKLYHETRDIYNLEYLIILYRGETYLQIAKGFLPYEQVKIINKKIAEYLIGEFS